MSNGLAQGQAGDLTEGVTRAAVGTAPVVPPVRRRRNVLVWISAVWLAVLILVALTAPLLPFASYGEAIGLPRADPSGVLSQWFGLDNQGRSVLSRIAYGGRVSLLVAAMAGTIATVIGTVLGLVAGYFRGLVDAVIMYVTDALLAFPPLVLLLTIASVLQPSFTTLVIGLTLLVIPTFARLARANTLNWASRDFVLAARNMGWGALRIAFREVLPNVIPSVLAYFPTVIAALIVAEGSLSFLGLGVPSPTPSWGGMIADGKDFLRTDPLLVFVPAMVIFVTIFALNQCGDYARNRFDRAVDR
ncbi:ABC transporter permease [Pseudonocardia oroxyli]|uniref:Peptide/nickel transport system permease protein n=1 Tax=Pseudonocardia oroxyli TaxID=366584 RepID=A0A1G8EPY3_PSEOR|nr:ABC transporter permease [Pseudonocardia oroxyli]SDH71950.1 peptide/nickel transport system permease protein [Pseudonocardia oroxyli]